jgi:hypothetical protein
MPLLGGFFIMAYTVVATAVVIDNWKAAATGVALLILFVGIYFGTQHLNKRDGVN